MISTGAAMPARRKSFADIIREGLDRPATMSAHLSRSPSRNSFDNTLGSMLVCLCQGVQSLSLCYLDLDIHLWVAELKKNNYYLNALNRLDIASSFQA